MVDHRKVTVVFPTKLLLKLWSDNNNNKTRFFCAIKKLILRLENGRIWKWFLIKSHYKYRAVTSKCFLRLSKSLRLTDRGRKSSSWSQRNDVWNRNIHETCVTKPWQIERKSSDCNAQIVSFVSELLLRRRKRKKEFNCVVCKRAFITTTKKKENSWIQLFWL